ncbi:hypothetical protein G5C51_17380 [Streptomyces sp. A7024]|uniref:Lipoprotein n=1 Tax=Streptomyces coryli TaxID=1128680 RepID=A0A6G4U0A6_9ACTN|nr:hypothetical protein [Streptomyces coryli]NGN65665.1 hypothetical protein [Streptomyces coryli]
MRKAVAPAAVLCAAMLTAVTGCADDPDEGTNGVGKLSASEIKAKTMAAAGKASSVRLEGSVVSSGRVYKLDMRLTRNGGTGEVSSKDGTFTLLRIDKALYMKAGSEFWLKQSTGEKDADSKADKVAAEKLSGKYVRVPGTDAAYKQLSGFTQMQVLLDGLLTMHGKVETGDRAEVGGVRTIQLSAGGGKGGTLDVSLEGAPYPMRLKRAGGAGVVELAQWGEEFAVKPPNKGEVVDYGEKVDS